MATFRRPDDLKRILPELVRQSDLLLGDARIVVVDNDPDGGAREAVERWRDRGVTYAHEPEPGISAARNRILDEAGNAEALVLIDDDELPVGRWLPMLVDRWREWGCAAVAGPVVAQFEVEPGRWVRGSGVFDRRSRPTGTVLAGAASNNLLLDLAQLRAFDLRFDEEFGTSGGEDTMLTHALVERGGQLRWCDEAEVLDFIPAERCTPSWVLRRVLRSSNSWSRVMLKLARTPKARMRVRISLTTRAVYRVGRSVARYGLSRLSGDIKERALATCDIYRGAGMVLGAYGDVRNEYRRSDHAENLTVLIANPSADIYGSDLQMVESVAAMRAEGWRVVVAIPTDGELVSKLRALGAEVDFVSFPVLRRANASSIQFLGMVFAAAKSVPRLRRYIRALQPSAVYVNTVTLPWWLLSARLARTPTVCHLHEAENQDRLFVRRLLVSPLRLATAVVVISQAAMKAMCDADPTLRRRAHLIYNGVPRPPLVVEKRQSDEPWRLITVGRLSPRKAPHVALEAAAILRSEGRDVEIELAGSAFEGYEWYVEELRNRAQRSDLVGAVHFSGYCSPIWNALERANFVVAPSLREPFGNAVVEAQYAGRPVVATAALGHLESITHETTGLLVPPDDAAAMADGVRRLMEEPELARRIANNAERNASTRFSTERYSQEVTDLVRRLANDSTATRRKGGGAR